MSTAVEAKLIISGQDQGASAAVRQVVNAFKQMSEASKVSTHVDKLTRSLLEQTKAQTAVANAMKARGSYDALQGDLKRTNAALTQSAKAFDDAKRAKAAFDGVKAAKGSDQAREIKEAANAVREAGAAYRRAEGDVRRVNAAIAAQASVMHQAESAAAALGADISNLAASERKLKSAIDGTTASLKAQLHAEEHGARASEQAAARRQRRREAVGTLASGAAVVASHRGKEIGLQAINAAGDFDYAVRYQHAVTDVSEADQRRLLIPQAQRIGQETKFSNRDIVEAQTATMQGLPFKDPTTKAEVGAAIVDNARYYGVLFKASMERSSEGIRNFLQNTNKDISTPEKAVKEAQRGTNLIVKAAKLGGASDEDAQMFMKFGLPIASQAGMKDTTAMSIFSTARRSGLKGDESGVFLRALTSKLISPTREGREAEIAAGIDRKRFQKMPEQMNAEAFEKIGKGRFGVKFNTSQQKRLSGMFQDGDLITNEDEFITKVSSVVGESFEKAKKGPNKGKIRAQDATKIAKLARDFYRMSVESTDIEGLWDAHLESKTFTPALRNKFYTDKHGGKAGMVAQHYDQFREDREELKKISETPNFARDKAMYMTQGLGGSLDNLKGSFETLVLNIGTANESLIKFAADGIAKGTDLFSNLSKTQQQVLSLAAGGAAVAGGAAGAYKLTSALLGGGASVALDGSAAKLTGAAVALEAAAARLGASGIPGGPGGNNVAAVPGGGPGAKPGPGGGPNLPLRPSVANATWFTAIAAAIGYTGWKGLEAVDAWMPTARPGARFSPMGNAIPGKGGEVYGPPMPSQRPRSLRQIRNGLDADDRPLSQSSAAPVAPISSVPAVPKAPSMTLQPGNASPGIGMTGVKAFGLDGIAEGAAKAGQDAGAKAGDGIKQGIDGKRSEVIGSAQQTFSSIKDVFGAGVTVPVKFDTSGAAAAAASVRQVATAAAPTIRQGNPAPAGGEDSRANAMARKLPAGGGLNGSIDRLESTTKQLADLKWSSHHTVEVSASPGLQARTRSMQASARGPIRADVGVSMPGSRSDSDWA